MHREHDVIMRQGNPKRELGRDWLSSQGATEKLFSSWLHGGKEGMEETQPLAELQVSEQLGWIGKRKGFRSFV
jgi:hypothetical protein